MNRNTFQRRSYSQNRHNGNTPQKAAAHPAQEAVEAQITQFEAKHSITISFVRDEATMSLFKRNKDVVIGFICTMYDNSGRCLSQGRGLSFVGYNGERYVNRAILYARNASLIDCAMRAGKMACLFDADETKESIEKTIELPSDKQVNYLKSLLQELPNEEQNDWLARLPQMSKYDVSQLIQQFKS